VARAHAKTGDAALISGYLGRSDAFDEALRRFARAYADQTEQDHAALVKAVKSERVRIEVKDVA
jgi:thiamine monophosphate kinase